MKNILKKISNFFKPPEKTYRIETTYCYPDFSTIQKIVNKLNIEPAYNEIKKARSLSRALDFKFRFERDESNHRLHWMFLKRHLHYWPSTGKWIACYDGTNPGHGRRVYGCGIESLDFFMSKVVVDQVKIEVVDEL